MYSGSFGPASNRADYSETIQLRASDEHAPPSIDEVELVIGKSSQCATLRKLLSAGQIAYDEELGEITFVLSTDDLRHFSAGTYDMGIVLTIDGAREQLFAGDIVIVDGVVS